MINLEISSLETVDQILAPTAFTSVQQVTDAVMDAASGMLTGDVTIQRAKELSALLKRLAQANSREFTGCRKPRRYGVLSDRPRPHADGAELTDELLSSTMKTIEMLTGQLAKQARTTEAFAVILRLIQCNMVLLEIRNELAIAPGAPDQAIARALYAAALTFAICNSCDG
jgi:hypothetical protein